MNDNVNCPNHYTQSGVECIDYIKDVISPFAGVVAGDIQNVLKYTWRAHDKNGAEDIKKAKWYMQHAIKMINKYGNNEFTAENGEDMVSLRSRNAVMGREQLMERLPEVERPYYRILMDSLISDNLSFRYYQGKVIEALDEWQSVFEGKQKSEEKNVNHPQHYANGKIECIDYLEIMVRPYTGIVAGCVQNALKYTWRSHGKNGVEDIEKAAWYLKFADKEINRQLSEHEKYGRLLSLHPLDERELNNEEKRLCREAYLQVAEALPTVTEKKCYTLLYGALKEGRFIKNDSYRKEAIQALEEWSKSYHKERKEIVVESLNNDISQSKKR